MRGAFDAAHRIDRALHDLARTLGFDAGVAHRGVGATGTLRRRPDGRGDLVHRGRGFLQRCRLLLSPLRQIVRGLADVVGAAVDAARRFRDLRQGAAQRCGRVVEVGLQLGIGGREAAVQLAGEIAVGQGGKPGRQRLGRLRGGSGLVLFGPDDGIAEDVDRPRDVADLVLLIQMRHGGRAILCGQPADRSGQAFDRRDDLRRDDEQRHGKHRDSGEHQCDHDRAVRLRGDGGVGAGLLRDLQLQVDELADRVGHRIDGSIQRGDDEMVERGAIAAIQNRLEFGDALVRNAHAGLRLVGQRGFVAGDAGGAIGLPMLMQGAQSSAHFCRRLGEAEIAVARLVRRIDDIDGIFVCDHLQIAHRHHPILQDRIERRLTVVHAPQRHACEQHDRHGEGCEARKELVADSHAILLRGPDKQHGLIKRFNMAINQMSESGLQNLLRAVTYWSRAPSGRI